MVKFCKGYREKCCRRAVLLRLHAKRNGPRLWVREMWLIAKIVTVQQMGEQGRSGALLSLSLSRGGAEVSSGLSGRDGCARSLCGEADLALRALWGSLMRNAPECCDGWQVWVVRSALESCSQGGKSVSSRGGKSRRWEPVFG